MVIAIIAILAAMLLPALAKAKAKALRIQCVSQQKQLGLGIMNYGVDRNDMFPPAGFHAGGGQVSWDSYINQYIGGRAAWDDLIVGVLWADSTPKVLRCPGDRGQKVDWMGDWLGVRTYAMVGAGKAWSTQIQVSTAGQSYPLPIPEMSVGMYWFDTAVSQPDPEAKSFKSGIVSDPSGTLLLVEQPNAQGAAGNEWPCVSVGPYGTGGWSDLYQIDPAPAPPQNQGRALYAQHGQRFTYLFTDGHVETLRVEQTYGSGSRITPKGMWTVARGD